jgi:creatinine amidohydrolase
VLQSPASGKKVLWQEMLRHELLAALEQRPVVIVPVGSVEQHGPHCPQDVDISIPYHLAIMAADAIDEFPVIVAPPVTYGFTHYNMGEVGTITLGPGDVHHVLCDVSRSLWANGFERIISSTGTVGTSSPLGRRREAGRGGCLAAGAHLLAHGGRRAGRLERGR